MVTQLVKNLDGDTWRKFTATCKYKNILVGEELTEILKRYLDDKK